MAILTGTSKTRYPPFDDPNTGAGVLLGQAQTAVLNFLGQSQQLFEEQFIEDGVSNIPGFSTVERSYAQVKKPTRRHVYTQRVQATVFIKKRIFSTLRSNYDIRLMNKDEKLFMRAAKKLFLRKTQDLAFYESLSNIENLFDDDGHLSIDRVGDGILDSLLTLIGGAFTGADIFGQRETIINALTSNPFLAPFAKMLIQLLELKELNQRAKGNQFTTWITDPNNPNLHGIGSGVGVIELNQVDSLTTNVTVEAGNGGCTLSMQDPYRTMVISELDIEIALRDAIAETNNPSERLDDLTSDLLNRAQLLDIKLNESRRSRNVSEINFSFILGAEQAIGSLVETGQEFDVYTISSVKDFAGSESAIVGEIFRLLSAWHTAQKRTMNLFTTINEEFADVRIRMRNEFLGHSIIQQMDAVHIFMNSRTRDISANQDPPINLTDFLSQGFQFQADALDISTIQTEHELTAPDVPFILYAALRDRSVYRQDGVQVFSGLVERIDTSYTANNGSFTISVTCKDNIKFLDLGRFTRDPNLAQPKALLYDPLTPFELKVDPATGIRQGDPELSSENKKRLRYLYYDDGLLEGEKPTEQNIYQEKLVGGRVTTFQHMPGLIYKWKDGIIAESLNAATRKPLNGIGATISDVTSTYGVTALENPFGGLDAADAVSILVTGRPHNYASFFRQAIDSGTFSLDNNNQNKNYFNYLLDFLERQDQVIGNFFPAVDSPVDPAIASAAFKKKKKLEGLNIKLLREERKLAELQDKVAASINQQKHIVGPPTETELALQSEEDGFLRSAFKDIQTEISVLKRDIAKISEEGEEGKNIGNDQVNAVSLGVAGNDTYLVFADEEIKNLKNRLKLQLKKKPEEVRYNLDKNYLVVSEQYTSDTDIQAFARNMKKKGPELWTSSYESPKDLCVTAAKSIGFEFFADSQGNINFRPPQYNRTPLSLLLKLIGLRRSEGVSYAPPFLESLFAKRSELILDQIVLAELKILEGMVLLGEPVHLDTIVYPGKIAGAKGIDSMTFSIFGSNVKGSIVWTPNEQYLIDEVNKLSIFNNEEQVALRNKNIELSPEVNSQAELLINIRNQINNLTGNKHKNKDPAKKDTDVKETLNDIKKQLSGEGGDVNAQSNRLKIVNNIAQQVSQRQRLIRSWAAIQDNRAGFRPDGFGPFSPATDNSNNESLIPSSVSAQLRGLGIDPTFPKFMEHLIENDLSNEDGFRSGKRFIIEDDVIISMSLTVSDPEFNFIEVTGSQDFINTSQETGGLSAQPFVFWAGAVDYDSWRRFGFRPASGGIFRADFVDAETQCAPYAVFKLQEQRRMIHRGSIKVMGNEFYQVGDVVYINNRSTLYYVEGVSHSFNFGSGVFETDLELSFGRALGEYIPTTLDIIGKGVLINNRKSVSNIKSSRSGVSKNHVVHIETLFAENYLFLEQNIARSETNFYKSNIDKVKNIIVKAQSRLRNPNKTIRIEVRTYYFKPNVIGLSGDLLLQAQLTEERAVKMGKWAGDIISNLEAIASNLGVNLKNNFDLSLPSEKIDVIDPINIDPDEKLSDKDKDLRRFPSSKAWSGTNPFTAPDGVGLPLNAVDVFFVIEDNKTGDQKKGN